LSLKECHLQVFSRVSWKSKQYAWLIACNKCRRPRISWDSWFNSRLWLLRNSFSMRSESEIRPLERNVTLSRHTISARTCDSGSSGCRCAVIMSQFSLLRSPSNLDVNSKVSTVLLQRGNSKPLSTYRRNIWWRTTSNSLPEGDLDGVSDLLSEAKTKIFNLPGICIWAAWENITAKHESLTDPIFPRLLKQVSSRFIVTHISCALYTDHRTRDQMLNTLSQLCCIQQMDQSLIKACIVWCNFILLAILVKLLLRIRRKIKEDFWDVIAHDMKQRYHGCLWRAAGRRFLLAHRHFSQCVWNSGTISSSGRAWLNQSLNLLWRTQVRFQ